MWESCQEIENKLAFHVVYSHQKRIYTIWCVEHEPSDNFQKPDQFINDTVCSDTLIQLWLEHNCGRGIKIEPESKALNKVPCETDRSVKPILFVFLSQVITNCFKRHLFHWFVQLYLIHNFHLCPQQVYKWTSYADNSYSKSKIFKSLLSLNSWNEMNLDWLGKMHKFLFLMTTFFETLFTCFCHFRIIVIFK